jgi:hypothetical protein
MVVAIAQARPPIIASLGFMQGKVYKPLLKEGKYDEAGP